MSKGPLREKERARNVPCKQGINGVCSCNGFKITFVSEKHVVEDDVLFTNHLAVK